MDVSGHHDTETGETVITIRVRPEDDPSGRLRQWSTYNADRLADFAALYGGQLPDTVNAAYWLLANGGRVTQLATRQLEAVIWHSHHDLGMSMRHIARALDRSPSTVQAMLNRISAGRTTEVDDHPTIPAGDLRRGQSGTVYADGQPIPAGTYCVESTESVLTVHRDGTVALDGQPYDLMTDPRLS